MEPNQAVDTQASCVGDEAQSMEHNQTLEIQLSNNQNPEVDCDAIEVEPLHHRFEIPEGNTVVASESPGVDRDWSSHFQTTIVFDSPESVKKWLLEKAREVHMTIIVGRSDFSKGRSPRIFYVCERSGAYKKARPSQGGLVKKTGTKSRQLKKTGTKKCECPFKIKMTNQSNDGDHWVVEVICGRHNHMLTPLIQGHACHAKLTPQEKEFFINLSKGGIKPKAALSILRERNPKCSTSLQTLYNVKKKANKEKVDRTVVQQMMTLGDQRDYIMLDRRDVDTDVMSMDTKSVAAQLRSSGLLQTQGLIGGKWTDAYDGKTIEVFDPATGDVIVNVSCMGRKETHDAISSANDAFKAWSRLTANERSKYLRKWYDLLISHREELAMLITLEGGKPLKEAIGEVNYGASFIEFYAEEAKRVYGDIIPPTLADRRLFVLKQPVGVVGAITPWNFPLAMITRKVGPALACGCTVVIKPSELTPLTALAAAELSLQAGIPPGVVNVVMGNAPEIGDSLIESTQVRKITFTGSTAVGKKLMAGAAATVKKVSLELGGNAPCIIFDDADIDVAVKGSIAAKFRNSGQTCVCANRILVQEGIYEKFANSFASAVQNLQVGNGFMDGVTQGPLINEAAVQKVESFLQDAVSKGAKVTVGGKRHSLGMTFYEPTVVSDVNSTMLLSREEAFGPIAPVLRFKTEEEAIQMANDTNAGLAAYIFTTNVQRSWRVAEALEFGMVGVNEGVISTEVAPFGGVKQSGLGREGSKYGMDEYQEIKYVCLGNLNSA